MASVIDFQERFEEFADASDDKIQLFLNDTALLMGDLAKWLDFYDTAHCYYAAHFLVVSEASETGDSGVLSPIKRKEVDDVTIENAITSVSPTFDELQSTTYGKRYYHYRRIITAGMYGV